MTGWGWFVCVYLYFAGAGALAMYLAVVPPLKDHPVQALLYSLFFIFTVPAFFVRMIWGALSNERKK